jgi:hypothetical protein
MPVVTYPSRAVRFRPIPVLGHALFAAIPLLESLEVRRDQPDREHAWSRKPVFSKKLAPMAIAGMQTSNVYHRQQEI